MLPEAATSPIMHNSPAHILGWLQVAIASAPQTIESYPSLYFMNKRHRIFRRFWKEMYGAFRSTAWMDNLKSRQAPY
jgi:hypothetical protein